MRQLIKQRLPVLQIARVESLGEPTVDRREKLASLLPLALLAPQPRHAHCGAEFPGLRLLPTGDGERTLEMLSCLSGILLCRLSAISPAMRLASASHHLSLVVFIVAIA